MKKEFNFNISFLKRFWRLHGIFYSSSQIASLLLFVVFLAESVGDALIVYRVGLVSGNFYSVLVDKDQSKFLSVCLWSTFWIVLVSLTKSFKLWLARRLVARWRFSLTSRMHSSYLFRLAFYRAQDQLDNLDQRITADVATLTQHYGDLIQNDLFILPGLIAWYAYKAYKAAGWIGPTGMFGMFLLSFINKIWMGPVVRRRAELEKREGNFRYQHLSFRDQSESIAFQDAGPAELPRLNLSLTSVIFMQTRLADWTLPLDIAIQLFNYLGSIASYLVISIPIFSGFYDYLSNGDLSGMISNNGFVCIMLIWQFTQLVNMTAKVANLAGSTHRVAELLEWLDKEVAGPEIDNIGPTRKGDKEKEALLELTNVDILQPGSEEPLVHGLNLVVGPESRVLIMGPSSAGKTSVLRVVKGLWPYGEKGSLTTTLEPSEVFYFPQREWLTPGSLREVVAGEKEDTGQDGEVVKLLGLTDLQGLLARFGGLDTSWEVDDGDHWTRQLSPGERQRLVFCQLLLARPRLALLDEATSAVGEEMQSKLYGECRARGVAIVSVGHRKSLKDLHTSLVMLDGRGGWTEETLQQK